MLYVKNISVRNSLMAIFIALGLLLVLPSSVQAFSKAETEFFQQPNQKNKKKKKNQKAGKRGRQKQFQNQPVPEPKQNAPQITPQQQAAQAAAASAQANKANQVAAAPPRKNDAKGNAIREEIQRYLGYEVLPLRYLSLPYDIFMNNNEQGAFLDIGFLLLIFLPILFLIGFFKNPKWGFLTLVGLAIVFLLSISVSYIMSPSYNPLQGQELSTYMQESGFSGSKQAVAHFYNGIHKTDIPGAFKQISGEKDAWTYPMLILLFTGFFFLLQTRIKEKDRITKAMINLLYLFSFLWLILTAGILWYGYLMVIIGLLIMTSGIFNYHKSGNKFKQVTFYSFGIFCFLSIMMSFFYRMANYEKIDEKSAQNIFNPGIVKYQLGAFDDKQVVEAFLPGSNIALSKINAEDASLIYRVGTFFPFFIQKNDRRILNDSQLAYFEILNNKYPNKDVLAEALKANGYKFILVDLNTATIDNTPEKTLVKKFQKFGEFIYQNPRLELLSTDRIVKNDGAPGGRSNSIYGEILHGGTYAAFEIK